MIIDDLDLKARGVLLTFLFLCNKDDVVSINQSAFARENGLSRQELRTILLRLQSTNLITKSPTNSATNITINQSIIYKDYKTHKKPIEQPNLQPIQQPTKTAAKEPIEWQGLMDFFNEKVKGTAIPQVRVLTETRKKHIRSLISKYGKAALVKAIDIVVESPFLRGENEKGWVAKFDWVFLESNFVKIMEGNYYEQRNNQNRSTASGRGPQRNSTVEGLARAIYELNHT